MQPLENNEIFLEPVSANCAKILQNKEHVLLGISPFNSYYSEERITRLVAWAKANFKNFHLFVPDTLPYFNFLALGYSEKEAKHKTKRQWNYLKNKIMRALQDTEGVGESQRIITVSEHLDANLRYNELCNVCTLKYEIDALFKSSCLDATRAIFSKELMLVNDEKLAIAVNYVLRELPLYLDTPKILNVKSSLFVYHDSIKFFTNFYINRNNELVAINQGHLILKL